MERCFFHDSDTTLANTSVTEVPLTAGVWKQWLCQSCLHWCWALVFGGERLAEEKQLNQRNGGSCAIFESSAGLEPICTYSWRQEGAAAWWDILPITLRTLNSKMFNTTWWRGKPCRPLYRPSWSTKCKQIPVPFQGAPKAKHLPLHLNYIWLSKAQGSHNPRLIWPHRTWAGCAYLQRQTSERASLDPRPRRNQSNR